MPEWVISRLPIRVNVEKTNLSNRDDIAVAIVIMAAGTDWVDAHGGTDAVRIIRYDPETETSQVLETRYLGTDEDGRMLFEGISPDGLSVFALAGEKQPETVATAEPVTTSSPAMPATPTETQPSADIPTLEQITGTDTTIDFKAWFMLLPVAGILALAWLIILYIRQRREAVISKDNATLPAATGMFGSIKETFHSVFDHADNHGTRGVTSCAGRAEHRARTVRCHPLQPAKITR